MYSSMAGSLKNIRVFHLHPLAGISVIPFYRVDFSTAAGKKRGYYFGTGLNTFS
jgi:hypothetical protein